MLPPAFTVTVDRRDDRVTISPAGELDLATAPLLADQFDVMGDVPVELDLSGMAFLDSSGVALLLGVSQRAARDGWPLTIAGAPPHARRLLELCGVLDALPLDGAPVEP